MSLVLHHLNDSRSHRLMVLLDELNLPYTVQTHARDKGRLAPEALRRVHPLGKAPILVDGDKVLVETGAIFEYLLETYGNGRLEPAPGAAAMLPFRQFMHYAEGSLMPVVYLSIVFTNAISQAPFFTGPVVAIVSAVTHMKYITPQLKLHVRYLEATLADRPWFTGSEFTAADIMMSYPLEVADARGQIPKGSRVADWLDRYRSRATYKQVNAATGVPDYAYGRPRPRPAA